LSLHLSSSLDALSEVDGKILHVSYECNESELLEAMKTKANVLVLKAIASQAAGTLRWSRTFLSDLWESEHMMRDEDSLSDSISTSSSSSTLGAIASSISSLTGINKGAATRTQSPSKRMQTITCSRSKFSVPSDIITKMRVNAQRDVSKKVWVRSSVSAKQCFPVTLHQANQMLNPGMATVVKLSDFSIPFPVCVERPIHGTEGVLPLLALERCQTSEFRYLSKNYA
jgi:hypothetical protein